nr:hypothetical transcript [Hymenolepis microstoma]
MIYVLAQHSLRSLLLFSLIINALNCLSVWIVALLFTLSDLDTLKAVVETTKLGIFGPESPPTVVQHPKCPITEDSWVNITTMREDRQSVRRGKNQRQDSTLTNRKKEVEQTAKTEDVQPWRRQPAVLRQIILQAKRTTFNSFISNINYQSDIQRTLRFLSNLLNNQEKLKKEPIRFEK